MGCLAVFVVGIVLPYAFGLLFPAIATPRMLLVVSMSGAVAAALLFRSVGRFRSEIQRAFEMGDPRPLDRAAADYERAAAAQPEALEYRATASVFRGDAAFLRNNWSEALRWYEAVEDAPLSDEQRASVSLNQAFCLAMTDRASEGVQRATDVLAGARGQPVDQLALIESTLAVARLRDGAPGDALTLLDGLVDVPRSVDLRARDSYFRGEALVELGRTREARAAFEQSLKIQSGGRWSALAQEALRRLAATPYRG